MSKNGIGCIHNIAATAENLNIVSSISFIFVFKSSVIRYSFISLCFNFQFLNLVISDFLYKTSYTSTSYKTHLKLVFHKYIVFISSFLICSICLITLFVTNILFSGVLFCNLEDTFTASQKKSSQFRFISLSKSQKSILILSSSLYKFKSIFELYSSSFCCISIDDATAFSAFS